MKKTININLGGQAFIIDEQAYEVLHAYFEALKQKFTNENERKEILADIEARVAEVFTQRLDKTRAVVSEDDVYYVISLMGRPEDIAGEPESAASNGGAKSTASSSVYTGPVEKKFFRDPDDKKVGGVISGLCHYFGWSDPTWVRIGFVATIVLSMFASLGLGFPLVVVYVILLIVVPEANTSAEKLQMQGKPVTLQNIEKEVRDAMTTAGTSVNSMMKDPKTGAGFLAVLLIIGRAIVKLVLAFVLFICIILMLALGTSFFGLSVLSSASLTDITHLLVSSRYTIMFFNIGLLLAIGVPLVSIMYDIIRYLTGSNVKNPALKRALWGGWLIGIVLLGFSSWSVFKYFAAADTSTEKVQLMSPAGGTLRVQLADTMGHALEIRNKGGDERFPSFIRIDGLSKTPYGFALSDLKMEVAVSPDSNYYVERVSFSRGANFADAAKNIQMIHYKFSQTDTTLNLDDEFELPASGKWRGQKVRIRVYMPEGKRITFADNVDQIESSVKGNDYFDDGVIANKTLYVENGKIKCLDCNGTTVTTEDEEKDEDADDNGKPVVTVQHGKHKDDLKDVSVTINQNGVSVSGKNEKEEKVKIKVDNQGVKVITTDTNGHTTITKKK